jgi:hypothetical protein
MHESRDVDLLHLGALAYEADVGGHGGARNAEQDDRDAQHGHAANLSVATRGAKPGFRREMRRS